MSDKEFTCRRCGHSATTKQNLIKHLNNKEKCEVLKGYENISIEHYLQTFKKQVSDDAVACQYCGSLFNQQRYLKPHLECCKYNPKSDKYHGPLPVEQQTDKQKIAILKDELRISQQQNKDLQNEIKELKAQLRNIDGNNGVNIVNNGNGTVNVNIIQNATIKNFGEETTTHITNQFILNCIMRETAGIRNFVEKLHFDEDVPENKNIRYKSTKRKIMEIVENNDWVAKDEKEVIRQIIRKACIRFREYYQQDEELIEKDETQFHQRVIGFLNELNEQKRRYKNTSDMLKALIETNTK